GVDRLQALVGVPAGVGQGYDVVAVESPAGGPAEVGQGTRLDAVELVHAQPQPAEEAGGGQFPQDPLQVCQVAEPEPVRHDFVEVEAQPGRPAAYGVQELRVQKRLAPGEPEDADAVIVGVLQEPQGDVDGEAVGPLNRNTTMRAGQVALIDPG